MKCSSFFHIPVTNSVSQDVSVVKHHPNFALGVREKDLRSECSKDCKSCHSSVFHSPALGFLGTQSHSAIGVEDTASFYCMFM